jgi:hypothetical protein
MQQAAEFIAGAVNSDGDVALILDRPLVRRPLFALLDDDGVLSAGSEKFRPDDAVVHAMRSQEKLLFVVMDGETIAQEFEVALRKAA